MMSFVDSMMMVVFVWIAQLSINDPNYLQSTTTRAIAATIAVVLSIFLGVLRCINFIDARDALGHGIPPPVLQYQFEFFGRIWEVSQHHWNEMRRWVRIGINVGEHAAPVAFVVFVIGSIPLHQPFLHLFTVGILGMTYTVSTFLFARNDRLLQQARRAEISAREAAEVARAQMAAAHMARDAALSAQNESQQRYDALSHRYEQLPATRGIT